MSKDAGVTHDTAARLIGISPADLERLVRDGFIRRNDRNAYSVPVLVENYVAWLKSSIAGTLGHPKQAEVAAHLDLSDRSVRELELKLGLNADYTLYDFRIAYIRHLREMAAGRYADGDLDLAKERSLLARVQREKIEMENAEKRGQLIPAAEVEPIMAEAVVFARERLLESASRLAREMPDGDPLGREEMLMAEFESFLHRLADWAHADEYGDELEGEA